MGATIIMAVRPIIVDPPTTVAPPIMLAGVIMTMVIITAMNGAIVGMNGVISAATTSVRTTEALHIFGAIDLDGCSVMLTG